MEYIEKTDNYVIRICEEHMITDVMKFIDEHWSKGHILATSKELVHWQYYNARHKYYNFIVAQDVHSNEILGVLGFIPTYIFDYDITDEEKFIWLALWKVREDVKSGGLGIKLLTAISKIEKTDKIGTVGINDKVEPIYKFMKYTTGQMDRFVIVNKSLSEYSLVVNDKTKSYDVENKYTYRILDKNEICELYSDISTNEYPKKTDNYYINRYYEHPFYDYDFVCIEENNNPCIIFVVRNGITEKGNGIRVVDVIGDFFKVGNVFGVMQNILTHYRAEFIDIFYNGDSNNGLIQMGFYNLKIDDEMIVANYFEPIVLKNVGIKYAYYMQGKEQNKTIFKGDGDQDRPNMI